MPPRIKLPGLRIQRAVPVLPVSDATLGLLEKGPLRGAGQSAEELPRTLRARFGIPEEIFETPDQPPLPLEWDALGFSPGTGETRRFGIDPLSDPAGLLASPLGADPVPTLAADPNLLRTRRLGAAEAGLPVAPPPEAVDAGLPGSGLELLRRFGNDPGRDEAEDILLSLRRVLEPEQLEDAIVGAGERGDPMRSLMHLREARGAAPGGPGRLEIDDSSGRAFVEGQLKSRGLLDEADAWENIEAKMRDVGVARPDPLDRTSLEAIGIHGVGREERFRPKSVRLAPRGFPTSELEALSTGAQTAKIVPESVDVQPGGMVRVADEGDFSSALMRATDVQPFDRQGVDPKYLAKIAKQLGIPSETIWQEQGFNKPPKPAGKRSPVLEALTRLGRGTQKVVALTPPESGKLRGRSVPGTVSAAQSPLREADLRPGGELLPPTELAAPTTKTIYPEKGVSASKPGALRPLTGTGATIVQGGQQWKVLAATEGAQRRAGRSVVQSVRLQQLDANGQPTDLIVRGTFQNGKLVGKLRKDPVTPEALGVEDPRTAARMAPREGNELLPTLRQMMTPSAVPASEPPAPVSALEIARRDRALKPDTQAAPATAPVPPEQTKTNSQIVNEMLKKLGVIGLAGGALLTSEDSEAEAAPGVKVLDPVFQELSRIRKAPVKQVSDVGAGGRFQEAFLDRLYRVKRFLAGASDPEAGEATGEAVHSIAGGGMGQAEVILDDVRQSLRAARAEGLEEPLDAFLSYASFDSAWKTLDDKIKAFDSNARAAAARGAGREAADWAQQSAMLQKNVLAGDVAPMGLTPQEIGQKLSDLEAQIGPEGAARVKELAEGVYSATRKALDALHEEGIVPDASYQEYLRRGNYLPMTRVMEEFDPAEGALKQQVGVINRNISGRESDALSLRQSKAIRSLEGSKRATLSPFEAAGMFVERAVREVKRNQAARTFLQFGAQDPALATVVKDLGTKLPGGKLPKDTGIMAFHEGGQTRYFAVPRDLADVMNLVHVEDMALGLKTLQSMRGVFQKLAASGNLAFAVAQTPRDIMDALMLPDYPKMTPRTGLEFAGLWVKNFTQNVMEAAGAPLRPEKQEFLNANAAFAGLSKRGDFLRHATGQRQGPLDFVASKVLNPIEEATKMTTFQTLRNQGVPEPKAAYETRVFGGSPDFWQAGSRMATANEFFVFLNPQVQGINRTVAAYSRDPQKLARHLLGLTAGMSALWGYNQQFVNPETGEKEINLIPEDERRQNIIILLPGDNIEQLSTGSQRRRYIKIPLGHAAQAIVTPMQEALRVASGDPSASPVDILEEGVSNFVPGSGALEMSSPSAFASSLTRKVGGSLNPLLKAPLEQLLNERFFNAAPIVGRRVEGREASEQYTERTSPSAKALGRAVASVPGMEDTYLASPDRLEHLYRTFLPGLGEAGLGVADALQGGPADTPARGGFEGLARAPVAGMLLRRFLPSVHNQLQLSGRDDLYDMAAQSQRATTTINDLAKRDPVRLQQLLANRPELAAGAEQNAFFTALTHQMSELGLAREQVMNDPALEAGVKTQKLREIYLLELQLLQQLGRVQE